PYQCLQCGQSFKKPSNLLSHRETHSRAKPYACKLCSKAHSQQGTPQQHRRLHSGGWPYGCADCGKAFARSSDLRKDQRNMHRNDKPFPCP
ncbi:ZN648 protein, partial [Sagittarius serpentarius]|nr:ZN648 protein [Sagittarius serpentarius]